MRPDLIIRNGKIIDSAAIREETIYIKNGRIISPYEIKDKSGVEEIDAKGKYILPGVIDSHTHFQMDYNRKRPDTPDTELKSCDSFTYGTRNAILAGTTTILDFAYQAKGFSITEAVGKRIEEMSNNCSCDYSLHCAISEVDKETINEMAEVKKMGISSFKIHTSYAKRGLRVEYGDIYHLMKKAKELDCLVIAHSEEERLIEAFIHEMLDSADFDVKNIERVRPEFVEAAAVCTLIMIAQHTGCRFHIAHMSSVRGLKEVKIAKLQDYDITAEITLPHLVLSSERYSNDNAYLYAVTPPLRGKDTIDRLWESIKVEDVGIISSNHCPFTKELKNMEKGNFSNLPSGLPGAEVLLPMLFTTGYKDGRLTLPQLVRLLCENPAKRMGLYGRKGAIKPGFDADLLIVDPGYSTHYKINSFEKVEYDWSPYEGMELFGYPETVLLRGKKMIANYKFVGEGNEGSFIERRMALDDKH